MDLSSDGMYSCLHAPVLLFSFHLQLYVVLALISVSCISAMQNRPRKKSQSLDKNKNVSAHFNILHLL